MRKRSAYRPKGVRLNALSWVLEGLQPLTALNNEALKLKILNHDALEDARQGRATRCTINILIAALNIAEALVLTEGLGQDWVDEISAGQDALRAMTVRGLGDNRFVFKALELTAVNLAMEICDAQLDACTIRQFEQAIALVQATERAGKCTKIEA